MGILSDEFKGSLRTSSIKGIPKAVTSVDPVQRMLWTTAVLLFLTMCFYQVSYNIAEYLDYPKVVSFNKKLIDAYNPEGTVPFPKIVVCNLNPFNSNGSVFREAGIPTPQEYLNLVNELLACKECLEGLTITAGVVESNLKHIRSYYQFIGKEAMAAVSHAELIRDCRVFVARGTAVVQEPCEPYTRRTSFVNLDYGMCFTYEVTVISEDYVIIGFNFVLHLDNPSDVSTFGLMFDRIHYSGGGVVLYDPHIMPTWTGDYVTAEPGTAVLATIQPHRTDRLSTPYSERECMERDSPQNQVVGNTTYKYNIHNCFGQCARESVEKYCNCTDIMTQHQPEYESPKMPYCASIRHPFKVVYQKINCAERIRSLAVSLCRKQCKEACTEFSYSMTPNKAKWPVSSEIAAFYQRYIANTSLQLKYARYEATFQAMASGSGNISELDKLLATKMVEDNFANIEVYVDTHYYTHLKEDPKLTLSAFIAQIGGTLNLWSGITVVVIVEFLDFCYRVLKGSSIKKTTVKHQINVTPVNSQINMDNIS